MMPSFRHTAITHPALVLAVSFALLFSAGAARGDDCKRVENILILFDASGYMKERNRYDLFLKTMREFEKAIPLTADGFFNVGLRHYGLRVGLGCRNTESVLAVQPWDPERFLNSFPKTVSYGVSSLSSGIRAAADEVAALDGKSVVIVIGGGLESCKSDPIKIADRIAYNYPELEIHTFQIGNAQEGRFFLEAIADKARGTFTRVRELGDSAGWHQWMKRVLVQPCGGPAAAPGQPPAVPPGQPVQPVPSPTAAIPEFAPVYFDYNSFTPRSKDPGINASNMDALQKVAAFLLANPTCRLVIHGYTDGKGSADYNLKLSKRRADAVSAYLTQQFRVPPDRMAVIPHGQARTTILKEGRSALKSGRRVEFEVFF